MNFWRTGVNSKENSNGRSRIPVDCRYLLGTFCFLMILFCDVSMAAPQDMTRGELQKIVDEYVSDKEGVLGAVVQVDIQGRGPLKAVHGYFDVTRERPIRPEDKFLIGSITKTFTATLVLQLVEMGKVELDGRLVDYVPPDWAEVISEVKYGKDITVEHVLGHRSGIYNVLARENFVELVLPDPSRKWAPLEVVRMIPVMGEPHFKPGESFRYSNTNYLLLSGLIEHVAGKPYIKVLQDNILSDIGLKNTFHSEGPFGSNRADVAHGYQKIDGKIYDGQEFDSSWAIAAGAMVSTTDDLIRYMKALVSGRLFRHEKTFHRMLHGLGEEERYGLGIEAVEESRFGPYMGHRGTFTNTSAALRYFPEHGIIISTCLTFDGTAERLRTDELLMVVMGKLLDMEYSPGHKWPEDVLDYTELDFRIDKIKTIEKYVMDRRVFSAKNENDKLIMVTLTGNTPRKGRFQYSPSRVSLHYKAGNEITTAPCLAVGMIFKTDEGAEEFWVASDEEFERITRTTIDKDEELKVYTLFELPRESREIEVRSHHY
jgi:D-alanyl-D-alanine carboxypeptidase